MARVLVRARVSATVKVRARFGVGVREKLRARVILGLYQLAPDGLVQVPIKGPHQVSNHGGDRRPARIQIRIRPMD